jgi:acetoin utilization deacetylase AcuC-like enzyme
LLLRLSPIRKELIYSPGYQLEIGSLPYDPLRAERILTFLFLEGLADSRNLHEPKTASMADLRRVHTDAYLESLSSPETLTQILGVDLWPDLAHRAMAAQRLAVGGTLQAMRLALQHRRVAVNLGGGFHHAAADSGAGLCIFNDVAVSIAAARSEGLEKPVLIVDLDLHDGNGTRRIFADDRSVFTFSIHNQCWDTEPAQASLSLELPGDVDDQTYLEALQESLPRVLRDIRPGLVFYLAGTDPAADDRLGNWQISAAGMLRRDRFVISQLRRRPLPLPTVVLLAGGYGHETWRYSARFFAWLLTDRADFEPPSTEEITYARYRRLVHILSRRRRSEQAQSDTWTLTEEDILGGLGASARPSRLLGHYSSHTVELVLERTGFLESLRGMGFPHPTVELDLDNPSGQTVRIFSDTHHSELLMELRIALDRRTLQDLELLKLEWLLLQNPRLSFSGEQRPLPGQTYPGLGLLSDVMALLILVCEELEIDGISFIPSHFHLAAKGKKYLWFVDPQDEAWFQAVAEALGELPLKESTLAVAAGRLVDRVSGEPVPWRPMLMVLPTSEDLRRRVRSEDYEREVATARGKYSFRLTGPG